MVQKGQNKLIRKIGFPSQVRFAYEFNMEFIGQTIKKTRQIGKGRNVELLVPAILILQT